MASIVNVETTGWTNTASLVISKPASVAVNDIMVAVIASSSSTAISAPAGWTTITAFNDGTTYGSSFYRRATSDDVSASNYTFTGGARMAGTIVAVTGTTLSQAPSYDLGYTGGVTPLSANSCLILANICSDNDAGSPEVNSYSIATSNPTWTERYDERYLSGGGIAYHYAIATAIRAESTPTGDFDVGYAAAPNLGEQGLLVVVHSAISETVSADVVTTASSAQAPTVTGGATLTADVVTLSSSAPDPTAGQATWSNTGKETTSWTNTTK